MSKLLLPLQGGVQRFRSRLPGGAALLARPENAAVDRELAPTTDHQQRTTQARERNQSSTMLLETLDSGNY